MAARKARSPVTVALTIAASDSGGGAGIPADLATFSAHGVFGAVVLTAVTAQDTKRILAVEPLSIPLIRRQMDAVFPDLEPAAVKIGMLYDAARIREVARGLVRHRARNVVLDPVLAAKDGSALLARRAEGFLLRTLFPLCDLVTPNLPEAARLAGRPIRDESDRRRAAEILKDFGPAAILIKGGHARGDVVEDLLFDGRRFVSYRHRRLRGGSLHGTGCMLSAAIAARLALGAGLGEAVAGAIGYLEAAIAGKMFPGRGRGVPGRFPPAAPIPRRARGMRGRGTPTRRRR